MTKRQEPPCCTKCGSDHVIQDGEVYDMNHGDTGRLLAGFEANPNWLLLKTKIYNAMRARVCGNCGLVELFVDDPRELYADYLKARGGA